MNDFDLKVGYTSIGIEYQAYNTSSNIPTSKCNSIQFRNQGTTTVMLDNVILILPGQTYSINGNAGERLEYTFNMVFLTDGATNSLVVMYKVYKS